MPDKAPVVRHILISNEQLELLLVAMYRLDSFIHSGNAAAVESEHDREEREALRACIADTIVEPVTDQLVIHSFVE